MINLVHDDRFFRVEHNPRDLLVRIARTAAPFADLAEAERAYDAVDRALSFVPARTKLLLDIREAPPRNDAGFEAMVKRARDRIFTRFARVAVLVRTAAGRLQVERMNRDLATPASVFDDEDRAFDHLLG